MIEFHAALAHAFDGIHHRHRPLHDEGGDDEAAAVAADGPSQGKEAAGLDVSRGGGGSGCTIEAYGRQAGTIASTDTAGARGTVNQD